MTTSALLLFSFYSLSVLGQLYTVPIVDDDFFWRIMLLDPTGIQNSLISDAAPPTGTFGNSSLGLLSAYLNGQYPQMFIMVQRLDKGQTYLGQTTCTYVDTCYLLHSVLVMSCTPISWVLTPGLDFFISAINSQAFLGCSNMPQIPSVYDNTTYDSPLVYNVPLVDDDFYWRVMQIDLTGQTNSRISNAVRPTGTFAWTPLGQLSIYINGAFPQMFLTVQRLDQGQTYLGMTTCTYVDTCLTQHSILEVSCTPVVWNAASNQTFFISANNTQAFIGCNQGVLPIYNNISVEPPHPNTYTVPVVDDDFNWRIMQIDLSGNTNSRISDAVPPSGTFASTDIGHLSIILSGQFPQMFLTVQRVDGSQTYSGSLTCTYVDTCYVQHSVLEVNCTSVVWTPNSGILFNVTALNSQPFIGCFTTTPSTQSTYPSQSQKSGVDALVTQGFTYLFALFLSYLIL